MKFDIGTMRIRILQTWLIWALPLEIIFYPTLNQFDIDILCFVISFDWYKKEIKERI
jgi:hypothetical protein